jgi:hypothetical protein
MSVGERLVRALAARDFDDAAPLLAPDFALKGVVPSGFREAAGREEAMEIFRRWFCDAEELESLSADSSVGRPHLAYRVRSAPQEGPRVFEQQAYYEDGPDGIVWMHVVCSGELPRG